MITKTMTTLLMVWLTCVSAAGQAEVERTVQTTVCDVVSHPLQYKRKLIQFRAQIWSDFGKSWLNESWAGSKQFGKVCRWLPAEFGRPTILSFSSAFATFTGRLVYESGHARGSVPVHFVVEDASDIYGQKEQNGPVITPLLYDFSSNTLIGPPK